MSEIEPRRMLNLQQVLDIVPVSRATLFRMIAAGHFPRSAGPTARRRFWYADVITAWQNEMDKHANWRRRKKRKAA